MTLSVQSTAEKHGRWAGMFPALGERYPVTTANPDLTPAERWRSRVRHLHPSRSTIEARVGFSEDTFARRSRHAEAALAAHDHDFDVILELQTLFAPGTQARPYVVYTDTTFARVREEWPEWVPISSAAADRFAELEQQVAQHARTVFTMCEHTRRSFIDDYGCAPERVANIGAAMALPPIDIDDRHWQEPIALFVGLDFARKGGEDLLAVWPQVRAAVPQAQLQVVGPRRAPQALPAGVQWLGRVDDRARLAEIYRRAAVFAMPSRFEPFGFVYGEAMANGVACIATPSCGFAEFLRDGVDGRVVPAGDHAALAAVLIEMLGDPDRCEQLGREAHRAITAASSWADVVERMDPGLRAAASRV